jgi:WD40 repeat protein
MNRFPLLPNWLVFFITSRPEDTVQSRLRTYNPCIKICAGNSGSAEFYEHHEQDIQRFLENRVNFSTLLYSAEEMKDRCNGMFLYAFYIAEILQNPAQLVEDIFPENINDYFCKNFRRVYEKVGGDFYKKLFGCALVAPSPLPVSFISFLLQKENSSLDEQEVIDAVSQFVALRTADKTFAFLHKVIPDWLTDVQKASRKLFVDRNEASSYFRSIIVEFLNAFLQQRRETISFAKPDLVNYILDVGFRFVCKCCVWDSGSSQTVFDCLTNYRFLQQRIRSNRIGIYSLIDDLEFSVLNLTFYETEKTILDDICSVLKRDKYVIVGCPELLHSCLSNASKLVQDKIMPNKVSASWMELGFKNLPFSANSTLRDLECCAFSHDKRLLAGGKDRCIFLYDALTFERVSDPVEVMVENLSHLEFSPDDKFLFFGRLCTLFSVEEKRVIEITQLSGNAECYEWGSFIDNGDYIDVRRKISKMPHKRWYHNFLEWTLEEFGLSREDVQNNYFGKHLLPLSVKRALLILTERFRREIEDPVDELFNVKSGKCSIDTESDDKSIASLRSISNNGKWLAVRDPSKIELVKIVNEARNGKAEKETVFHYIENVHSHAFTNDSFVFVYVTLSPSQNLYALSLQTGTKLCSVSGLFPVCCASEEGEGIGYIFRGANERIAVLLRDLPGKFLLNCKTGDGVTSKPVAVTFTPAHTIMILCSDAKFALWKLDHSDLIMACYSKTLELDYSEKISIEKCVFSHDGKLIAIHHSCQILLFNCEGKFLCSVFKVIEECKYTAPCLTFSPDDSLLLFCIQKGTSDQTFYVWNVKKEVLTDPILLPIPYVIHVECCCFSSDNRKLFFCNASSVLILEYPSKVVSCPTIIVPHVNSRASDTCSHCIVSSDNMLLAWCVANEIFIFSLNGSDTFWKVPHNHFGKVEYFYFLRGNCYLISYGIDGIVFLFDIFEKKSIAYVKLESIISMALSPDEDKVVCLESSGKLSVINLYGLKPGLPSDFKLPSNFRLHAQINHQPQRTQIIAAPFQTETAGDEFIIDDDERMSFYSSESGDEDVADKMHFTSDHSAAHSDADK